MKLTASQIKKINSHVLNEYPKEAVFAITSDNKLVILDNINPDPENFFSIDEMKLDNLDPIALIHSHTYKIGNLPPEFLGPVDFRMPSKMDMQAQMLLDIEFGIVSCDGYEVSEILWYPDLDAPMLGQQYISGVNDCYSIIRRYYWQTYGIKLDENPRDYHWYDAEPNKYVDDYKKFGWYDVNISDMEQGDMLIIRIGHHESHSGLYLGNGKFIHHLNGQLSRTDDISRWIKRITRVVRHKDKPQQ